MDRQPPSTDDAKQLEVAREVIARRRAALSALAADDAEARAAAEVIMDEDRDLLDGLAKS